MLDGGNVGNVSHYEPSNALVITGKASTVNRMLEVIKRVDVMGDEQEQIIPLKYASAVDLADVLNTLSRENAKEAQPATLQTHIVADKRSNALIIRLRRARAIIAEVENVLIPRSKGKETRGYGTWYAKADKLVHVLTGVTQKLKNGKGITNMSK